MLSVSAIMGLALQCASTIHPDTVKDVARVESGFNPFAIAEIIPKEKRNPGDKSVVSYFPSTLESAIDIVNKIELRHHRYSIGLMQITSTNFSKYGMNAEKLFDPCNSLFVFEKIITDCYLRGGTVKKALSCYYSGDFNTGQKPEKDFSQTSYVQRIGYNPPGSGYVVPSTKEDQQQQNAPAAPPESLPPAFESWDILREYPRPPVPQPPAEGEKKEEQKPELSGKTLAG